MKLKIARTIFSALALLSVMLFTSTSASADTYTSWHLYHSETYCVYYPYMAAGLRGSRMARYYYYRTVMRDNGTTYKQYRSEEKLVGLGGAHGCPLK